jgi:hypothetical protein
MSKNVEHKELINSLKRNPDNAFFLDLVKLLEFRLDIIKNQLVDASDNEYKKLQGQGFELRTMLSDLKRRPVDSPFTGGFD